MKNKSLPLIILGIIALSFIVFVICPLFLGIKHDSTALVSQKCLLAELENRGENLKKFQATYETNRANLDKIDQLLVNQEEPVGFIEFLEKEANDFRLSIGITPFTLKEAGEDYWPSISFQLTLDGSFPNFLRFLEKIESSPYLVDLSNFNLRKPAENSNGDIEVFLLMKVYTKK